MSAKPAAILFDMDGTLLDSRPAIIPSFEYALAQHDVAVPKLADMMPHSHSLRSLQEAVAPHIPYDKLLASYDERLEQLLDKITLYDDVAEVLESLHKRYKLALVSSARRAAVSMERYGLAHFFDAVVGGLDVAQHKPHPEPVLRALGLLDVQPQQAVMVGDLAVDVLASQAAGLQASIGVTHGFGSREVLETAGADYVAGSLLEVHRIIEDL